MNKIITERETISPITRQDIYQHYINKYYNAFMSRYECTKGLDIEQFEYMLKQFWVNGSIACFKLEGSEGATNHPQGAVVLCPFAPSQYNIYDFPTMATMINTRGVRFIPSRSLKVNEEVVVGYIQKSKRSVRYMVEYYLKKIVDIEMTIRTNLKAMKTPWLLGVSPENKTKMESIWKALDGDNPKLFIDIDDVNSIKALVSGANYNIDKLYDLRCAYENELKEYLGIDNLGVTEKKEHLITSEIEANNEVIETNKESFISVLDEFTDRVKQVLNYDIEIRIKDTPMETKFSKEDKKLEEESY